jgi:hypothetical protein
MAAGTPCEREVPAESGRDSWEGAGRALAAPPV